MFIARLCSLPDGARLLGNSFVLGFFLGFCLGVTLGAQRAAVCNFRGGRLVVGDDILPTGLFGIVEQRSDGDFAVGC